MSAWEGGHECQPPRTSCSRYRMLGNDERRPRLVLANVRKWELGHPAFIRPRLDLPWRLRLLAAHGDAQQTRNEQHERASLDRDPVHVVSQPRTVMRGERKVSQRTVSRILFPRPPSPLRAPASRERRFLWPRHHWQESSDRPGSSTDGPSRSGLRRGPPYLVLLRAGFCVPPVLPRARCALTAPFHPYSPSPFRVSAGGMFSVPLSFRSP